MRPGLLPLKPIAAWVLAPVCLFACQGPAAQPPRAPANAARPAEPAVSRLVLTPTWQQPQSRRLQATVTPLGPSDVSFVEVELWQPEPALLLASAALDPTATTPLTFGSLLRNRSYRALGRAYAVDESSNTLPISDDNGSSITLAVGPADAVVQASLPIRLQDTPFAATGRSSGTVIIPGELTYEDEEALVLGP